VHVLKLVLSACLALSRAGIEQVSKAGAKTRRQHHPHATHTHKYNPQSTQSCVARLQLQARTVADESSWRTDALSAHEVFKLKFIRELNRGSSVRFRFRFLFRLLSLQAFDKFRCAVAASCTFPLYPPDRRATAALGRSALAAWHKFVQCVQRCV